MKANPYFFALFGLMIVSFSLSYWSSNLARLNEGEALYPYSVVKRYSDQGQTWLAVSNQAKFDSQNLNQIEIQTGSTEILIRPSKGNEIGIELEGKYLPRTDDSGKILKTEVQNDLLKVKTDEDKASQNFKRGEGLDRGILTLHLPTKIQMLKISTLSGRVSSKGIGSAWISIETRSGDIDLQQVQGKEIEFKTASGEVTLSGLFERLSGDTQSGDLQIISENSASKIKLNSASSDIEVYYSKKPNARLEFQTKSGTIGMDWLNSEFESTGPYVAVLGSGLGELQVYSVSGNLSVGLDR